MNQAHVTKLLANVGPAAFQAFGDRAQMIKTIEELAELSQALCKRLNGAPVTDDQIIDEVADVLVMAGQMQFLYGVDAVYARMDYKLNRTAAFILSRKGNGS